MFLAVMVGAGFVQCAEDTVSQMSLPPAYSMQAADGVSHMIFPPAYDLAVDFFNEEQLPITKQEIMERYLLQKYQEAKFIPKKLSPSLAFSLNWSDQRSSVIENPTFREEIETALIRYLNFIKVVAYARHRNSESVYNPYLEKFFNDPARRIEMKGHLDRMIELIKFIHGKLVHDRKFFGMRSEFERQEIDGAMDALRDANNSFLRLI